MNDDTPDDLWTPYKQLVKIVETFITNQSSETNVTVLDSALRKHKQNFTALLKHPPKNAKNREDLRQGITDGIVLPGLGRTTISKDLVDESIIISDMYDMNEYIALELLCTAQHQMPHHPGLARGLVAILLYYDGRKSLVSVLKDMFQARAGISWSTDAAPEVTQLLTDYTDSLVADGILIKIIDLLETLDITKEIEVLSANRALGPPKHHRQVIDLFDEIRTQLASCLFNWSAQCGLGKDVILKLIGYLSKHSSKDSRGSMDDVTLSLLMALLYGLDLSVLQRRDDGEEIVKNLPLVADENIVQNLMDTLQRPWENDEMRSIALFAFGLAMATLRNAPPAIQANAIQAIDQDESTIDQAIQAKIFDFMHHTLLQNPNVFKTEFYFRRIHILLTDFVELMHSKVTELRARADETARTVQTWLQQGLDPPTNLCRNFETLLLTVGKLYENDKLGLCLCLEYWGPMDVPENYHKSTSRSVSLFKFVRLAGELLQPDLFVPYVKMLAGLSSCQQSARNAFNLLKQGSNMSSNTKLSWDHFFGSLSRYYTTLRQEQNPSNDTVYRNRVLNRGINPQEIAGLQAVLGVIRAVANHDEIARVALCEHPKWSPLHILLGLVSCSVNISLKADLLHTLASLAKSKETAVQLWNNIEASQIIATIPSTSAYAMRGIQTELDEIECRNETFPLTQALLDLLYTLVSTALPKKLGAGPRKPGLDPYLTFLVNSILLRFHYRNYKDPGEKWTIAYKCCKILDMFVRVYQISPQDFCANDQYKHENSPPGYHIMLQMHTKSDLLRVILSIIDEGCSLFDTYAVFPGKKDLELCCLHCLNIIEMSLAQQNLFFDAHFSANCTIMMSGLNKLLLDVNPRSDNPDHVLNITKFVTYNSWMPKHTLLAIKCLTYVTRQPKVSAPLLTTFTHRHQIKTEIQQGFVECLETDGLTDSDKTDDDSPTIEEIEVEIKSAIIQLLDECLPQLSPNIAHYLLGFDIGKDLRATQFHQPGVLNFPNTCVKSLITLLDMALDGMKNGIVISEKHEKLVESAYTLLASLCSNPATSEPILRYLRSCNDFLCRHISALPFRNSCNARVLNQMSGLLKCVAIELKVTAFNNQLTQYGSICKVLLGIVHDANAIDSISLELSHYYSLVPNNTLSVLGDSTNPNGRQSGDHGTQMLITQLLECLDFEIQSFTRPKWNFFDNASMADLFQNCEAQVNDELKVIDVNKLHTVLKEELYTVQATMAAGQRQLIMQEIEEVLVYALQINAQKTMCSSTAKFLEAWGQVTETLFSVAPQFVISIETKQNMILDILQALLNKVVTTQIMPELARIASSSVLLLLVNLRFCYMYNSCPTGQSAASSLSSTFLMASQQPSYSPKTNSLSLKFILRNMVEWIIGSSVASQKLKINLYAALLNFIHIIKHNDKGASHDMDDNRMYISRLDKSTILSDRHSNSEKENHCQMAIELFSSFGEKLVDILCHDCTGGHDVCKMLSLSCIDMLLTIDGLSSFVESFSRRGYLQHLVDSLIKTDIALCQILENMPDNMKALYVYESKLAMLGRVASTEVGAELLLEHKTLGILSGMKVFDLHPDLHANTSIADFGGNAFVPSVELRYQQILFPALNLCDVILSTLGPDNHSAITQIIHFLLSHGNMIEVVLRAGTPFLNLGLLKELAALTGLIARTANQDLSVFMEMNVNQDLSAHLYRLQKLMLTLYPRFVLSEKTLREIVKDRIGGSTQDQLKVEQMKYFLQTACNLGLYMRNAIANHSADHRTTTILFSPSINEAQRSEKRGSTLEISPSLTVVVAQLRYSVEYYTNEKRAYDGLLRQRNSLPSFSLDANVQNQQTLLTAKLAGKRDELKLCVFLAENSLYLLWAHLDFYMLRAIPVNSLEFNKSASFVDNSFGGGAMSANEAGWKVTSDDISQLKKYLISIFNETFCKNLTATAQEHNTNDKGFVEAILRRIQRLIQFVPVI